MINLRIIRKPGNKAQNFIEYTLILGVVGLALFSMQAYFKRGIQSVIKVTADDLGPQGEPLFRKYIDEPEVYKAKLSDHKRIEDVIKTTFYPKGNAKTYYSYEAGKELPIENKYTYTSTSTENTTTENMGQGNIVRKVNKGVAESLDISH